MSDLTSITPIVAPDPSQATTPVKPPTAATSPTTTPAPAPSTASSASPSSTDGGAAPSTGDTSGIPYQLHYDVETQRFILEARDPKTGAIIISLPPQTALQQIQSSAAVTADSPLGHRVDKNA